jgi:pyrrolysine biosynthesis protein PylC
MVKAAIIGGRLQGTEAAYLAMKAGFKTVLIDKCESVPAANLCGRFLCFDILRAQPELINELKTCDFILPALENKEALDTLVQLRDMHGLNLAFDPNSYSITSSKRSSDILMEEYGIPAPKYYPNCKEPYIVKPSDLSGSSGVRYIKSKIEMELYLNSRPKNEIWIGQEFLSGPSYSIEVIGRPGCYRTYEITQIHMDEGYDCKMVTAPCEINKERAQGFSDMAKKLACLVNLYGIMDVEVINDGEKFKVLEIDARIPSQTPTVVYHSTGINLMEEIRDLFCGGFNAVNIIENKKAVSYEHLLIGNGKIRAQGEHIMAEASPLSCYTDFCGADEVLTDKKPGDKLWRATFINTADGFIELERKRERMFSEIEAYQGEGLEYVDSSPFEL